MNTYTFEMHTSNIEFLTEACVMEGGQLQEGVLFSRVNALADFVEQHNMHYSELNQFTLLAEALFEIITYCNSDKYEFQLLLDRYTHIITILQYLIAEIVHFYPTNVYFAGTDKYNMITSILGNDVNFMGDLLAWNTEQDVGAFNVLICSEETFEESRNFGMFHEVISYDKFMNNMFERTMESYFSSIASYDYNYLMNSINVAKNKSKSIVIGNSYSRNGIDVVSFTDEDENMVNLSTSSQDFYYSFKIARNIINENKEIKKCYIGTGYWSFYHDLSKAQNKLEEQRIEHIFLPLLNDAHNNKNVNKRNRQMVLKSILGGGSRSFIFHLNNLYNKLSEIIFLTNKSYFNSRIKRDIFSFNGSKRMESLSEKEKYWLGKFRSDQLSKLVRYEETRVENVKLMEDFLCYLNENQVQAIIVNFPTSKYYNENIIREFKESYYDIFNDLQKRCHFTLIDLNSKAEFFHDEDYTDVDHLSMNGAVKATQLLREMLIS